MRFGTHVPPADGCPLARFVHGMLQTNENGNCALTEICHSVHQALVKAEK
jgi:hypothetical protein